jgi:3-dehydroquinate dehydratase-1
MKTVTLRGVEIGAGAPKVIVPIVGRTRAYILAQAAGLAALPVDMAEWRADFYEDVLDLEKTLDTLKALRAALGDLPLLFTFRTRREGGEREISPEDYRALNLAAARSGDADAVDVEIFSGDELVRQIIDAVHAAGGAVVGSSHDHCGTPPREELTARLCRAQELGADLPKLAVTPQSPDDVLTLLDATQEMVRRRAGQPVITMSMGPLGTVSRLCGEVFGSAMTFGSAGQASAPGQIPAEELRQVLDILHRALGEQ